MGVVERLLRKRLNRRIGANGANRPVRWSAWGRIFLRGVDVELDSAGVTFCLGRNHR